MSNYTITTDFGAKDRLPSGNAAKVIKGSEFSAEFTNIKTAVNSKADLVSPTFTGNTALNGTTTFGPDGTSTFNGTVNFTKDVTFDTNTMFIDVSENRVGIGNVAPATALDVIGTVTASGLTVDTTTLHVDATNNRVGIGTTNPATSLHVLNASDTQIRLSQTGEGSYDLGVIDGDKFAINRDGLTNEFVISAGRVGIGTASPDTLLEVVGADPILTIRDSETTSANTNATLRLAESGGSDTLGNYWDINHTGNGELRFVQDRDGVNNERIRINLAGNVGIGTSSPARALHVTGGNDTVRLQSTGSNTKIEMVNTGSTTNEFGFLSNNFFVSPDGTERLRIDSSGNVGIGTTNPAESLHTSGNIRFGDTAPAEIYTNSSELRLGVDRNNDNTTSNITFYTNNDEKARFTASGKLLIGKTDESVINIVGIEAHPAGLLVATRDGNIPLIANRKTTPGDVVQLRKDNQPVGSISVTGSTTSYNTSSDERLKENITDSADAGSKIDAIQIRQFDWKADGLHQDYGVIAQELVEVAPEAVSEGDTEEDMMGVDYSKLVPMLIKEVQTLRNRVAQLENN
jgi:hypothetical protein